MITELTAEQKARFPEFVDKWTKIGLSTEPTNRELAEEGIREAYAVAGLKEPKIVWFSSPFAMHLAHVIVKSQPASVGASVGASVWAGVGAGVRASVGASVGASVRDSVRDSVWAGVRASVRASVWDSVWAGVRASVRDSVGASVWAGVGAGVWASVRASVYGQHDVSWLAFYDYMSQVLGLTHQTAKLAGLEKVARSANWWLPCENICFVCERHNVLCLDELGRLHNPDGLACGYPDGWGVYAIHGTLVTEQIIKRDYTLQDIQNEGNAEIKRIMIDLYGEERYVEELGLEPYHSDVWGTLYRVEYGDVEPLCFVKVTCPSTGRVYYNQVPPLDDLGNKMERTKQAIAWRFGMTEDQYLPLKES